MEKIKSVEAYKVAVILRRRLFECPTELALFNSFINQMDTLSKLGCDHFVVKVLDELNHSTYESIR